MQTSRQTINHLDGVLDFPADAHFEALLETGQYAQLQRFRADFLEALPGGVQPDIVTCFRYLQLAAWNNAEARRCLVATLAWRQEAGIDSFFLTPPRHALSERYRRARVFQRIGHDKAGNALVFDKVGHFASSGCIDAFTPQEWWLLYAWEMENCLKDMRQLSADQDRHVYQYTYIGDCAGLSMGILWYLPMLHHYDKLATIHYPELVGRVVLINAPAFWVKIWDAVCLLVDKVHMDKIEVHQGVPTTRLLELVSREQLPRALGGDLDLAIPACCSLEDLPPVVAGAALAGA